LIALLCSLLLSASANAQTKRSGYDQMGAALQAMQDDDSANPAFLWVKTGKALWSTPQGNDKSCLSCHGAPETMKGVSLRYPAWDTLRGTPLNLAGRINACRTTHQQAPAWPLESEPVLALQALIGLQSRGMSIVALDDPRLSEFAARGKALFHQRLGQLDLSCAQCHDERAGLKLGGALIPEGHSNGYPIYRLEWQNLGSLSRRLRNCMTGVRADAWPQGATQFTELEIYLVQRAVGLKSEAPGVRP
jgi:L-cysteine S-thiosulfotransferase